MKAQKIPLKIEESITGFAAPCSVLLARDELRSYLPLFRFQVGEVAWHGHLKEFTGPSTGIHSVLIGPELANQFSLQSEPFVTLTESQLDPAESITLEIVDPSGDEGPLIIGIELQQGRCFSVENTVYRVTDCKPEAAYLNPDTDIDIPNRSASIHLSDLQSPDEKSPGYDSHVFQDIIGQDHATKLIEDYILQPLSDPEFADTYLQIQPTAALFYGPPGTGKATTVEAIARSLKRRLITLTVAEVAIEGLAKIRQLYAGLKSDSKPAIIHFDHFDRFFVGNAPKQSIEMVVVESLEKARKKQKAFTIATTRQPEQIPVELKRPDLFYPLIEFSLPDTAARIKLLERFLRKKPTSKPINIEKLAEKMKGYSPADIRSMIHMAGQQAYIRHIQSGDPSHLTVEDLYDSMHHFRTTKSKLIGM